MSKAQRLYRSILDSERSLTQGGDAFRDGQSIPDCKRFDADFVWGYEAARIEQERKTAKGQRE